MTGLINVTYKLFIWNLLFYVFDVLEGVTFGQAIWSYERTAAAVEHEDHHVADCRHVVSATRIIEIELINARKNHVASKNLSFGHR